MKPNLRISYSLVALQFMALGILALTGPVITRPPFWLALEAGGLALGLWALWSMRNSPPNITPDVRPQATLVRAGPYRWIRHPMYTMLILISVALVGNAAFAAALGGGGAACGRAGCQVALRRAFALCAFRRVSCIPANQQTPDPIHLLA